MNIKGNLIKMKSQLNAPVDYYLNMEEKDFHVNSWLNKKISIRYQNQISCINCGKTTKTSFFQGHCYSCFTTLPQTDASVVNPELCQAHEGISRDMEWAKKNSLIDHYVYLSYTSGLKVGVTRHTQVPTRWIDQGAEQAIILAQTPYRQLAGLIEVELKQHLKDKTNWRKMLSGTASNVPDLLDEKDDAARLLPDEYHEFISDDDRIYEITYPVLQYPDKIKSVNLDKTPEFEGVLTGIKGQYLLFDNKHVFNVRKHNGYLVELEVEE